MTFKWKIKGFDNYIVSCEGFIVRKAYATEHMHYKTARFVRHNSRNQFRLWREGKEEIWSKKQLRNVLVEMKPLELPDSCPLKDSPF